MMVIVLFPHSSPLSRVNMPSNPLNYMLKQTILLILYYIMLYYIISYHIILYYIIYMCVCALFCGANTSDQKHKKTQQNVTNKI